MLRDELNRRAQWLNTPGPRSRQELLDEQSRRLCAIVRHAQKEVPLYRERFAGLDLRDFTGLSDLPRLPVLTRAELQNVTIDQRLAATVTQKGLRHYRTSGSSGRPLDIYMSENEDTMYALGKRFVYQELGAPMHGCMASVVLPKGTFPVPKDPRQLHAVFVDSRLPPQQIAEELRRLKPTSITGFPSALCSLAESCTPEELESIRPELIILSGEVCTPKMRQLIADALPVRITSTYACNEARWVAGECARTGHLHIADHSVVVEVLDEHGHPVGSGEEGDVVITALHGFSQPFIRYQIGDRAVVGAPTGDPSGCECGAPYATLQRVLGRMNDTLVLPGGRSMSAYELTSPLLQSAPFVGRYQLVQEREDWIRWRFSPLREPSESEIDHVKSHAREVLGEDVRFDVEWDTSLEQSDNGKFRIVHNKVTSRFDD